MFVRTRPSRVPHNHRATVWTTGRKNRHMHVGARLTISSLCAGVLSSIAVLVVVSAGPKYIKAHTTRKSHLPHIRKWAIGSLRSPATKYIKAIGGKFSRTPN